MESLRFRVATARDVDRVAEIIHGCPGREAVALLGGEGRARRFGVALTRLQARGDAWCRTIVAELGGRSVAVLQWRPASEQALPISTELAWATLRALGPIGAVSAWRRDRVRRRVNPTPPFEAFHVEEIHVLPSFRGRGIGGSLLEHAERVASSRGFRRVSLITHTENPAQRLYRRRGFEEVDRREDPAYERLTGISGRLLMTKRLGPAPDMAEAGSRMAFDQRSSRKLVQHDTDLWSAEYPLAWQAGLVPIPVRMTVIRLRDGSLVLHSPAPLSPGLREELDALGRVAFIVVPRMHGRFAGQAAEAYPSARVLAAPGAPSRRKSLPLHASLEDRPPAAWAGQVESHLVRGFRLHEVVLFHRPSRTLVITDLCFNVHRSPSAVARAFFRANGVWRRFGPSRVIRLLGVSDREAFRRSLEQVLQWDFERIVPGHGDVLEQGGPAALRAAWLG